VVVGQECDIAQYEKLYIELMEKEWETDDEPDFPLEYKVAFLYMFSVLFGDNASYTRSEETIQKMKEVHERNLDNTYVAYKYVQALLHRSTNVWSMYVETSDEYNKQILEIADKYAFSDEIKTEIDFKISKISFDFSISCIKDDGVKHLDKMIQICKDTKKLSYITDTGKLVLQLLPNMPEEFESNKETIGDILESIFNDEFKDNPEKDYTFVCLNLCLLNLSHTIYYKD
jgi:hypothetical protein